MSKVPSDLWRKVMQATAKYEEQWALGTEPTPEIFASDYPDIPRDLLTPELERLRIELSTESLPNYSNLTPLGKGGMGEVFEAHDRDCQRSVAIKKIRWEFKDNHHARKRFQLEAELTASLEHPGVIPVYGLGIDDQGLEYYAMRLIRGQGTGTLADAISAYHDEQTGQKRRETLLELIRRLIDVADTIAYAHQQNVVHRDLKPSNILIGPYGETLIADWGLARQVPPIHSPIDPSDSSSDAAVDLGPNPVTPLTDCTQGVGTPGYADPELTRMPNSQMLRSADIYSLGAVLHCILTGSRPTHDGSNPNRLSHKMDKSIVAICNQAMATAPANRYASVEEFREDLKRWIAGLPTKAYPEPWWERTIKWPSRHRSLAAGLAGALAILILGGTAFLWFQADRNRKLQDQAIKLENALTQSKLLSDQTQRAEQESRLARSLAEKRESMAFESLERFQDLFVSSLDAFPSKSLNGLRAQVSSATIEGFETYLTEFEAETQPTHLSIERVRKITQKLAALEGISGQDFKASSLIDRTCSALAVRIEEFQEDQDSRRPFLELQIGMLRSLQGNLAMRNGKPDAAKPALEEAVRRLEPLLDSQGLSGQTRSEALASWLKAISALGMHQAVLGDPQQAHAMMQKASLSCENQEATSFDAAMARIQFFANWSMISERIGNTDLAIEKLQKARISTEDAFKRVAENPGGLDSGADNKVKPSLELLSFRSAIEHNLARLLIAINQRAQGLKTIEELWGVESESLLQSPSSFALQSQYQQTATTLQSTFDRIGRNSKALGVSSQWISFAQKLKESNPTDGSAMVFLINAYHQYGHLLEKYSRRDEALEAYQNALEVCTQASERSLVSAQLLYQQVELQMHRFHLLLPTSSPQQTKDNFLTALHTALRLGLFTKSDSPERVAARSQLYRGIDALVQAGLAQEAQEFRARIKEFEDLP